MKLCGHLLKAAGCLATVAGILFPGKEAMAQDSAAFGKIDSTLNLYLAALDGEPPEIQKENIDFIIDECEGDTATARHVALKIYDHFKSSPVMGAEAMAIYLTDTRFSTGEIRMRSDTELAGAELFAAFNRNSLIGMKAPQAAFTTAGNGTVLIPEDCKGTLSILYFYDTGCPVCLMESFHLKSEAENGMLGGVKARLIAVYTGQDELAWESYISEYLPESTDSLEVTNVWDPGYSSDFPRLYGVLSTPKMFLIGKDGTILGRNLDTEALKTLISRITSPPQITPGEMRLLVDVALGTYGKKDCKNVMALVDTFREQLRNTSCMEKTAFLEALYYDLRYRDTYPYKCGAAYLAKEEILSGTGQWDSSTINDAKVFTRLYDMTPLGEIVPDIPLPDMKGTLYSIDSPLTVIYAYSESCRRCEEEMPVARRLEKEYGGRVRFVYIDCDKYDVERFMLEYYDLSLLPAIYLLGEDKTLYAKYLDTEDLENLLGQILREPSL